MGEVIIANAIKREKGKLYYIDGEGNLCVADMKRGRTKKAKNKNIIIQSKGGAK